MAACGFARRDSNYGKGPHMTLSKLAIGLAAALAAAALVATGPAPASAAPHLTLKSICRIKGHEENSLQGLGIVVGLKGTGDNASYLPTIRSVAKVMTLMRNAPGKNVLVELKDTKNVALVLVTATVPAMGARQGDKIDAVVSSIGSAKSLAGGRLFLAPLVGPDPRNPRVYAFADGPLTLENPAIPTTGRVHDGCRLEEDFFNVFTKDNKITLVLEKHHADFQVAEDITELINSQLRLQTSSATPMARALNPGNIEVAIPMQYRDDPVSFVSQVLALPISEPQTGARVVINERAGSIIISGDVEIGSVAVTHKNIVIEAGSSNTKPFVGVDPVDPASPKLKALVESLNAIHAPTEDIIEIIKGLGRDGKLHAPLIIE
jgi:flagellar P-ring protein precursor FlgI